MEKLPRALEGIDINPEHWNKFVLSRIGRINLKYESLDELREGIQSYGLPKSMAEFNILDFDLGSEYIKNDYREWSAIAYPPINRYRLFLVKYKNDPNGKESTFNTYGVDEENVRERVMFNEAKRYPQFEILSIFEVTDS